MLSQVWLLALLWARELDLTLREAFVHSLGFGLLAPLARRAMISPPPSLPVMKIPASLQTLTALLCTSAALLISACGGDNTPAASNTTGNSTASAGNMTAPAATPTPATNAKAFRVAFLPKGMQNVYWKSVEAGYKAAVEEFAKEGVKVDVNWNGPPNEQARDLQIGMVEGLIADKVDGIILCPLDADALVNVTKKVRQAGIPVVIVDSALNFNDIVSFIATNNDAAGHLAATELAKEMGDKGNVIMMRFNPGSASTDYRENGFLAEMKANHPNIKILSSDVYAGDNPDKATTQGQNLLDSFKGQVDGVFTPNEPSTNGMLNALRTAGLAGKVKFVGFDGGAKNMEGFDKGEINALVLQDPYTMGKLGLETMVNYLMGKKVEAHVDTDTVLLSKDTKDTQVVKDLLAHTVSQ
jgi:ribose transport system substrate-binding protein